MDARHALPAILSGRARGSRVRLHKERLYTAIVRDISERKAQQRKLEHQATHDSLTLLPNRAALMQRLEAALASDGTAGRAPDARPVPLQGGQRHARPQCRRPGAPRSRPAFRQRSATRDSSRGSAATSSPRCSTAGDAHGVTTPPTGSPTACANRSTWPASRSRSASASASRDARRIARRRRSSSMRTSRCMSPSAAARIRVL